MNGYQLLNEVGTGGTLSSLFTILSLFTENVKISWQDDDFHGDTDIDTDAESVRSSDRSTVRSPIRVRARRSDSDVSAMNLNLASQMTGSPRVMSPRSRGRGASVSSSGSTIHAADIPSPGRRRSSSQGPSISGRSTTSTQTASTRRRPVPVPESASYGVVARASEDSTLAVIPAEAFRRLTKKFPKAAAHIVQGKPKHLSEKTTFADSNSSISYPYTILSRHIQRCP